MGDTTKLCERIEDATAECDSYFRTEYWSDRRNGVCAMRDSFEGSYRLTHVRQLELLESAFDLLNTINRRLVSRGQRPKGLALIQKLADVIADAGLHDQDKKEEAAALSPAA